MSTRFWNPSELIRMFPWKSIIKIPIPIFSLDFAKIGIGILVRDFYEVGQVSKPTSLQFKTSLNSLRPSISEFWSKQKRNVRNPCSLTLYRCRKKFNDLYFYTAPLGDEFLFFFSLSSVHIYIYNSVRDPVNGKIITFSYLQIYFLCIVIRKKKEFLVE